MYLRWGIVTAGKICHDFVTAFNSYSARGCQRIVAIASRDINRAEDFATRHNIANVFDSYQAMATSNVIDIAYIGAINTQHFELSKLFLENGKHVLCEKPLCMNANQVASLINLSRKNKLYLMEGIWSRFAPAYVTLEKLINNGKLGDVKLLQVNFGKSIADMDRIRKKALGGGATLCLGVYVLQLAQFIFKEAPINVTARGELQDGVDITDRIILEYSGGRRAILNINAKMKLCNEATIFGSKGRVTLQDPFHFPTELVHVDGSVESFPLHTSHLGYNYLNSAGLVYQALEVAKCIEKGLLESPRMSHEDSLTLARLEDEVRRQVGVQYDVDYIQYP